MAGEDLCVAVWAGLVGDIFDVNDGGSESYELPDVASATFSPTTFQ